VADATEDTNGNSWFGVNKSSLLLQWDYNKKRFSEMAPDTIPGVKGLSFGGVSCVYADKKGRLWVSYEGAGLFSYDISQHKAKLYSIEDGLPSNYIYSITPDDKQRLWLGTAKGLICFFPEANKFILFKKENGLPAEEFGTDADYFDSETNSLWLTCKTDVLRINPDRLLEQASNSFSIYTDEIKINGKKLHTYPGSSFRHDENNIQFEFTAVDIDNGKDLEFSYQLRGADANWIYAGDKRSAIYNSLGPGNYTFIIKAKRKGDTGWIEIKDPFSFSIATPWWQSWWFRITLAVAIISFSWLLIRTYYRNKFLRQKSMMEKEIAIEQERTKMARELHDGLGSMLSGVKHSFTAMTRDFELDDKQKLLFHSNLGKLNESIKELRNISHNMASDALLKYGLETSLRDYCNNASLNSGISVSFTALDTKDLNINEEKSVHIFRVIQELFQNIIKHSDAKNVVVQISNNNRQLYITVEDDGKGFNLAGTKKQHGIGLKNIETRVKLLKGDLDYKTAPGKGTSVLMTIPCN
jgi:signal transduction histidine kinase